MAQDQAEQIAIDQPSKLTTDINNSSDELFLGRYYEDEELAISLIIDKYLLGEVFGVTTKNGFAFDFEALVSALEFPIEQQNNIRVYSGWYISPANRFDMNLENLEEITIQTKNSTNIFSGSDVFYKDDILYISRSAIAKVFQITFDITPHNLEARVKSEQRLPVIERLARQGRVTSSFNRSESRFVELYRGYGVWSPQIIDLQTSLTYRDSNDTVLSNYSLLGARDIGQVHTNLFLSGNDAEYLNSARLTFSKESNNADLLGVLGATSVEFGDVRPVRQGNSQGESFGIRIENSKLNNVFDIQETNLVGPIQIGWDVELYRNGTLIKQQFDIQTGQYEFLDTPLIYGENNFEIVMYSPQGEIVKDLKTIVVDKALFEADALKYSVSLVDTTQNLFNKSNYVSEIDYGYQFASDFRKSFGGKYLVGLGVSSNFGGDVSGSSLNLSLNTHLFDSTSASLNYAVDNNGNFLSSASTRLNVFDQPIGIGISYSETRSAANPNNFISTSGLRLDHSVTVPVFDLFSISAESNLVLSETSDYSRLNFENSLSTSGRFGALSLISNYEENDFFNTDTLQKETENSFTGSLSYFKGFGPVFTRFGLSYDHADEFELSNAFASFNWNINSKHRIRMNYNHDLISDSSLTSFQYGLRTSFADIYTNASVRSTGDWEIGTTFRFSFSGQSVAHGEYIQTNRFLTQTGNISVRVFNDKNLNGIYEPNEEVLEGVEVIALQHFAKNVTNSEGIAVLTSIPNYKLTDITVDEDTFPDFYFKPLVQGVAITFRRGYTDTLDFPVALTRELEGTVYIQKGDKLETARSVPLIVKNSKGKHIASVSSEYDGFYLVSGLFAGQYTVEIDPMYLKRKRLKESAPIPFTIDIKNNEYYVFDFELTPFKQVEMYTVRYGAFSSEKMMMLYHNMLVRNKGLTGSFYYSEANNQYYLSSQTFALYEEANQLCQKLGEIGISCELASSNIIVR